MRLSHLAVFVGGSAGAAGRLGLTELLPAVSTGEWPWPTFTANIAGAFLVGLLLTVLQEERERISVYRRALLATGFCGALTTFATLQVELLRMIEHGDVLTAGSYLVGSVVTGLIAVLGATWLVRNLRTIRV